MKQPIAIVPDQIHILSIRILGGNITSNPTVQASQIKNYIIQYGASNELNYDARIFRFVIAIGISALDSAGKEIGVTGQYTIEFVFRIDNISDYEVKVDHKNKHVEFDAVLPSTLLSIAYSTSRGIILSRTQGTILEGVILPVVDINSFLKQMDEGKKLNEKTVEVTF